MQGIQVVVVCDFGVCVLMNDFLGARNIARHRKKQGEGNHHLAAQQVDCEQLHYGLRIRVQDSAARAMRRNRVGEGQLAEMLVYARVGFARQLDVRRPGHLERREVIRVRAGTQQPEHVLRVVPDFNPDRLHAGGVYIRPQHANAVLGAEHRGTDLDAATCFRDGPCPQQRVARVGGYRPCGATGKDYHHAGQTSDACERHAHGSSVSIGCFRNPCSKGCHGSISMSVRDVSALSNSRTLRIPVVK